MKRKMIILLVMALIAGPFLMGGATAKTLKIGTVSPLTGSYAADGNDIANGVRTAVAVITAEGGIPGFDNIEVVSQDTACDPRQAVAAANKLIDEGVVGVVGAYCSSSTIPASETLAEEDIPMLGLAPLIVQRIFDIVRDINTRDGTTILLVEQNANIALQIAQRGYVLETGKMVMEDRAENLLDNPDIRKAYLGEA